MRFPRAQKWLLVSVLLAVTAVAVADESLRSAYAAILQGDYDAGRTAIERLLEAGKPTEQVEQVEHWLSSFQNVISSREELRQKTFDWNAQRGQEQLEQGHIYLAANFAAQAEAYAADKRAFANSPWIKELRTQALAKAEEYAHSERWIKAHAFYLVLSRIDEQDEEVKALREQAARHARLEVIYETKDDVDRRIKDVNYDMLVRSLDLIKESYYKEPDFKKMAQGALDNLVALCTTTKLYKGPEASSYFDGVADPAAREYFLSKLEEQRQQLEKRSDFDEDDVKRLYNTIKEENKKSVSLPPELLIVEFTEGALGKLDDFTSVVWPADASEFDKMMIGNFVGVGIQLGLDELSGRLKVVTPLADSPALEKGIQPEDLIIAVNGESTKDWSTDKAVREITGEEGTEVTLTIYRPSNGKRIDFTLKRRPIELPTIRGVTRLESARGEAWNYMLDEQAGIAYIRLTNFNPGSTEELQDALKQARAQGMRGLILDLRNNPGGLLDVAVGTVSTFLRDGEVVKTDGRREAPTCLDVSGKAAFADLPMVVLVNEGSASASEILAGALQDHDRAIVLGERTFGKGSVQRVYPLRQPSFFGGSRSKARLKLTTALYYLPNGESPHKLPDAKKWGVDPDCPVELMPKEFGKVMERFNTAFIIHNEDKSAEQVDPETRDQELEALKVNEEPDEEDLLSDADIKLLRSDPCEAPDADPQLETALLQLRVKLAANMPWPRQLAKRTEVEAAAP